MLFLAIVIINFYIVLKIITGWQTLVHFLRRPTAGRKKVSPAVDLVSYLALCYMYLISSAIKIKHKICGGKAMEHGSF